MVKKWTQSSRMVQLEVIANLYYPFNALTGNCEQISPHYICITAICKMVAEKKGRNLGTNGHRRAQRVKCVS